MEKYRDNTSCVDYQGQSIVECDLKMESRAQELADQMVHAEQLLKQKEQEVEVWEQKYNKINEELATLKEKLTNENLNNVEVCMSVYNCFEVVQVYVYLHTHSIDDLFGRCFILYLNLFKSKVTLLFSAIKAIF